jgi:hypothetical protein
MSRAETDPSEAMVGGRDSCPLAESRGLGGVPENVVARARRSIRPSTNPFVNSAFYPGKGSK